MANLTEQQEAFEFWVTSISDRIREHLQKLPEELTSKLDFSIASLDLLERFILDHYTFENMQSEDNKNRLDFFATYVGETFRKNLKGAYWDINLTDPDLAYYGLPVITGAEGQSVDVCPHTLVTASLDREQGDFIRTVLENTLDDEE